METKCQVALRITIKFVKDFGNCLTQRTAITKIEICQTCNFDILPNMFDVI